MHKKKLNNYLPGFSAVVMGASAGGLETLGIILSKLPEHFPAPVIIVQHISPDSESFWVEYLDRQCRIRVKEAEDKELLRAGTAYAAPPDYHLQVEEDHTLSLSADGKVNFSRPSIDVLFESAADAYRSNLVGVILTGANNDGAKGLERIKALEGLTVVQTPESAYAGEMPLAAVAAAAPVHYILDPDAIGQLLIDIFK